MPNIIYAWEAGEALGHVSVFLPIAKRLRERGWQVTFAIPHQAVIGDSAVKKILDAGGYRYIDAPGASALTAPIDTDCHAELLCNSPAFSSSIALAYVLRSWCCIYKDETPDLVIGDFAPAALLAARHAHITAVSMDQGYFYPDVSLPLPRFSRDAPAPKHKEPEVEPSIPAEEQVLTLVNAALTAIGSQPLTNFCEIYRSDRHLLLNFAELCAFPRKDPSQCLGAVTSENEGDVPVWPNPAAPGGKIFAYMHAGSSYLQAVMEALTRQTERSIIFYILGCTQQLAERCSTPYMTVVTKPVDMAIVLQSTDLIICHGGVGMISQALLAGIPLMLAPNHFEQQQNAARVAQLGAGASIGKNSSADEVHVLLDYLMSWPMFTAHARAFQYRNQAADPDQIVNSLVDLANATAPLTRNRPSSNEGRRAHLSEYDVVFLSYDEPNADENWKHLQQLVPSAKRVHGVRGFDAAHKAAAAAATSERFILVDADNRVSPEFFNLRLDVPPQLRHAVWQWSSINNVNGLAYPFGGLKVWTKEIINGMKTHEACETTNSPLAVDFWAQPAYQVFSPSYSTNITNASPYQAFRAGFRETHKLAKWYGRVNSPADFERLAQEPQARRVSIWMSVGADVDHGYWSMLGARLGFLKSFDAEFIENNINHYDWFSELWREILHDVVEKNGEAVPASMGKTGKALGSEALVDAVIKSGEKVRELIKRPAVIDMNAEQSANFRAALIESIPKDRTAFTFFKPYSDFQ